jgi:hypothetical protein
MWLAETTPLNLKSYGVVYHVKSALQRYFGRAGAPGCITIVHETRPIDSQRVAAVLTRAALSEETGSWND